MLFKSFSGNNMKRYAMVPVFDKGEESIFRFGPEDEQNGIGVQSGNALLACASSAFSCDCGSSPLRLPDLDRIQAGLTEGRFFARLPARPAETIPFANALYLQ